MEHNLPFDPTYGHDLDALLKVGRPPEPADFADFWRAMYAKTLRVAPRLEMREVRRDARMIVYEVEYDGLNEFRVGGWITTPLDGKVRRGVVVGHGYGGRENVDWSPAHEGAAAIFPCGRGFHRSARPFLPDRGGVHVLHGITSRDTYIHGHCVADFWAAVSALLSMYPQIEGQIDYAGGSFGGGIGAMALPWEPRFRRAFLEVPSFGNHPLRVTYPCHGSGESVRLYHQTHPEVLDVLTYFDAATAAAHTTIPTLVAAALFDPAVPPPGQFAVYNALAGEKKLFVRTAGHWGYPEETAENASVIRAIRSWFLGD